MRHDTDHVRTPDALAQGSPGAAAGALATATPTTRRLAAHSLSANTRAAYSCALRQFDTWRGAAPATDATLAAYLGFLFEQGRAPATAALVVAAVTFRATLAGTPVRGPQTDRVLAGFRRDGADRGRGQAANRAPSPPAAARSTRRSPLCSSREGSAAAAAAGLPGRLTAHKRPGGAGLGTHRARRVHHRRDARRGVENRADGRALQRRGHRGTRRGRALPVAPGATGRQADKQDAWRCARSPLDGVGDARGTGPPDPAGLRHPRLSVRGRTGRAASARCLGRSPCRSVARFGA